MEEHTEFVDMQASLEELPDVMPEDPADHGETALCLISLNDL
ncbi:hypothetical protein ACWD6P_14895 [Streptomyces sp. NPDC002446]